MRVAIALVATLLSSCTTAIDGKTPSLDAVASPLCLFNCMTVIHYANGVETVVETPKPIGPR